MELKGQWRNKGVSIVVAAMCLLLSAAGGWSGEPGQDTCEKKRGLVILAEFQGLTPAVDKSFVRDRFDKLGRYVRQMSYGKVCPEFHITGWHRLPHPVGHYALSPANLMVDKSLVSDLIQDAIDAADGPNLFSGYSYVILFLGASFKEYGMVGLCGYPGMLGWSRDIIFTTKSGQTVPGGVAIFTWQAHLGTLFHDVAHVWGGVRDGKRVLPCLYDHDIQARHPTRATGFEEALINMGFWDPMSCHFYERNLPPPGLSSWTRLRLGWIGQDKIRTVDPKQGGETVLGPLEKGASETLVIKIPLSDSEYYLIENRQPIGMFDSRLPGKGVLIMYADDRVGECRHGMAPVKLINANPSVPHLKGAAFDLPGKDRFVDKERGIEIRLVEKTGDSYRVTITALKK